MENESIKEFRENFNKIYQEQVIPVLKTMDRERFDLLNRLNKLRQFTHLSALVIAIPSIILTFFVFIPLLIPGLFICFFIICIVECAIAENKKTYEKTIKQKIMPILMPPLNFVWQEEPCVYMNDIENSKLINELNFYVEDDNFLGSYKNTYIKISELIIRGNNRSRKFSGIFISIEIHKNFKGHTIVLPKYDKRTPYQKVELEDVEFNKQFNIYSTNQVEARYLITPAFMQRFKNIQHIFGADTISCSFRDNVLMIAIPTNKDLFSLGDLNSSVVDASQFNTFLNELISIFELIEELKLCNNTELEYGN